MLVRDTDKGNCMHGGYEKPMDHPFRFSWDLKLLLKNKKPEFKNNNNVLYMFKNINPIPNTQS